MILDPETRGQETIEQLERANLFIVPLDGDRRWYRYHHLFRDLLAQRLNQAETHAAIDARRLRASRWYEENGFDVEAFEQAAAGHDFDRAERLIEGGGLPLHVRGRACADPRLALDTAGRRLRGAPEAAGDARDRASRERLHRPAGAINRLLARTAG